MKAFSNLPVAAVSLMLFAAQAQAQATVVTRCNVDVDGTFVPALIYVAGGTQTIVRLGEQGLTRTALFSEDKALAFVRAQLGDTAGELAYVDCAAANDGDAAVDVPDPVAPPPPPPEDEGDGDDSPPGGGGCGYPD